MGNVEQANEFKEALHASATAGQDALRDELEAKHADEVCATPACPCRNFKGRLLVGVYTPRVAAYLHEHDQITRFGSRVANKSIYNSSLPY